MPTVRELRRWLHARNRWQGEPDDVADDRINEALRAGELSVAEWAVPTRKEVPPGPSLGGPIVQLVQEAVATMPRPDKRHRRATMKVSTQLRTWLKLNAWSSDDDNSDDDFRRAAILAVQRGKIPAELRASVMADLSDQDKKEILRVLRDAVRVELETPALVLGQGKGDGRGAGGADPVGGRTDAGRARHEDRRSGRRRRAWPVHGEKCGPNIEGESGPRQRSAGPDPERGGARPGWGVPSAIALKTPGLAGAIRPLDQQERLALEKMMDEEVWAGEVGGDVTSSGGPAHGQESDRRLAEWRPLCKPGVFRQQPSGGAFAPQRAVPFVETVDIPRGSTVDSGS